MYINMKDFMNDLRNTLKEKIAAADATAKDAEQKRNEYDQLMKEEYSRGRHYREVLNMLDEINQKYYNASKELEKSDGITQANTTTDPKSIITAYNVDSFCHSDPVNLNATAIVRQNGRYDE